MTLDEAIEHAREVTRTCNDHQCAADHAQLAEWLSLLKVYTDTGMAKEVQRARHEMHGWQLEWKREMERRKEIEAENAKLRERVTRLQADWESERDYADQMEAKEKMAVSENRKLRELVSALDWCTESFDLPNKCDECQLQQSDALTPECEVMMQELGIEVDDG